jgi:hypothetical protein
MVRLQPTVKLAWFVLRAVFWLGLVSLFVPGLLPRQIVPASEVDAVGEKPSQDTLRPVDRVASWHKPRSHLGADNRSAAAANGTFVSNRR